MRADLEHRILGRTGLRVSALGLGTVELGTDYGIRIPGAAGPPSEAAAVELLRSAAGYGVDFYDTAPTYGSAERLLGEALGDRREPVFATKVSVPRDPHGQRLRGSELRVEVERSLEASRIGLRRATLDVVQVHNATLDVIADGELSRVLVEAKARGEVRAIGASVYTEDEALAAIGAGCYDVLQVAFNLLDRRMANRVIPAAQAEGVAIIARSVFLKGVLTPKARVFPPELGELVRAADRMRETLGITWEDLPAAALRFCLYSPGVAAIVIGVDTAQELDRALAAAEAGPLPETTLRRAEVSALTDERLLHPSEWPTL